MSFSSYKANLHLCVEESQKIPMAFSKKKKSKHTLCSQKIENQVYLLGTMEEKDDCVLNFLEDFFLFTYVDEDCNDT